LIPIGENIKRLVTKGEVLRLTLTVAAAALIIAMFAYLEKDVKVNDDGKIIEINTIASTVGQAFKLNDIYVTPDDFVSTPLDAKLHRDTLNEVYIKRAVPVRIAADGTETILMTYKDTVGEVLEDSPVKPSVLDVLEGVSTDDKITEGMTIKIVRVNEEYVSEKEPIPFDTVKRPNNRMDVGVEKVVSAGQEGELEKQYKVVKRDGIEISRELIREMVLSNPVSAIVEFGTVRKLKTNRGEVFRYSEVKNMRATAYTASFKDTGKHPDDPGFGITRTGIKAKKGVVAVDPKVIPLGTRLYIEIEGSTPDYGYAIAADTGGAIKGNKIDLYYDSQEYVDSFGVKKAKVYILLDE
jgi:uncharacterized protein YabE (DUF348 family)